MRYTKYRTVGRLFMEKKVKKFTFRTQESTMVFLENLKQKRLNSSINQTLSDILEEYKKKTEILEEPENSPFLQEFIKQTKKTQNELTDITESTLNQAIKAINENTELLTQLIILNRYNSDKLSMLEEELNLFTGENNFDDNNIYEEKSDELLSGALEILEKKGETDEE